MGDLTDKLVSLVEKFEKFDPHAPRDQSEPWRRRAFVSLIVAQVVLGIWGILCFTQILGEHEGKVVPANINGEIGGWDTGNDTAHVISTLVGTLVIMVCMVLVNDPANHPLRFTKSYKEGVVSIGWSLMVVAKACFLTGVIDSMAVAEHSTCKNCSRAEYIGTCVFAFFAWIFVSVAASLVIVFGRKTPEKLANVDLQTQALLKVAAKNNRIELPEDTVAVVAVVAPCCGSLIPLPELESHKVRCYEEKRLEAEKKKKEKEERKRARRAAMEEELKKKEANAVVAEAHIAIEEHRDNEAAAEEKEHGQEEVGVSL
eukprot:TRINITY_DN6396_c0_g1_i11.p2 TRINITY_DN6396_c0_g1~~TRINITY_DN6396_c0_g1_i11.p2  ORF type:complete len:315 (-),score=125.17 TRINITY_DN6396_c0_g1_i11:181-1125(-)